MYRKTWNVEITVMGDYLTAGFIWESAAKDLSGGERIVAVNGKRFDKVDMDEAMTTITLTPLVDLIPGDKVGYADVVEYKTSLNADLWPTLSFEYTYGSNCATALPIPDVAPIITAFLILHTPIINKEKANRTHEMADLL